MEGDRVARRRTRGPAGWWCLVSQPGSYEATGASRHHAQVRRPRNALPSPLGTHAAASKDQRDVFVVGASRWSAACEKRRFRTSTPGSRHDDGPAPLQVGWAVVVELRSQRLGGADVGQNLVIPAVDTAGFRRHPDPLWVAHDSGEGLPDLSTCEGVASTSNPSSAQSSGAFGPDQQPPQLFKIGTPSARIASLARSLTSVSYRSCEVCRYVMFVDGAVAT